jgi:hypothetical protein
MYMVFFSGRWTGSPCFPTGICGLARLALLLTLVAGVLPTAAQEHSTDLSPPPASDLFTRVTTNQKNSETILDQYERTQRVEKRRAASDPNPLSTTCWRLFPTGPGVDKIPLTPEGKPPKTEIYRSELEKLEKYLAWIVQDGETQKESYSRAERKRKERFNLMDTTHQAFRFTLEGQETRKGRILLRYTMAPNPEYRPTSRNTILFTRVRGTIWVDEQSSQLAKIDGSVTEDFSIAVFLAKVYKGSHFMQERYEVAPGVWEPTFEQYDFDGRKFMVPFSIHERTFYSNYKRVGSPKEALDVVRAELNKLPADQLSQ